MGRLIHGSGAAPSDYMLVGSGPGYEETNKGRVFCGKTGVELRRYLNGEDIPEWDEWFLTNLHREYKGKDVPYVAADTELGGEHLRRELARVQPKHIVTLGREAARWFLGNVDMEDVHGIPWLAGTDTGGSLGSASLYRTCGLVVFPCYHVAAGFHSADLNSFVAYDFQQLANYFNGELHARKLYDDPIPSPTYVEITTVAELDAVLGEYHRRCRGARESWPHIAIDTEGYPGEPWSIQFSFERGHAFLIRSNSHITLARFADFLNRNRPRLVYHSALHDIGRLRELHLPTDLDFDDTMESAYLLQIEPQGLKPLCVRHCNMRMQSYDDVVGDSQQRIALDWMQGIWDIEEIEHAARCEDAFWVEIDKGRRISKFPKRPKTALHKAVSRCLGSKDAYKLWDNQVEDIRVAGYNRLGPVPKATLDHVPRATAVGYGCLSGTSRVETEEGFKTISELVSRKYCGRVRSWNPKTRQYELNHVVGWYRNTHDAHIDWLSVCTEHSRGSRWGVGTRYTPDHRLLTERGWIPVSEIEVGTDRILLPIACLSPCQWQIAIGSVLGDGCVSRRNIGGWGILRFSNNERQSAYVAWKAELLGSVYGSSGVSHNTKSFENARPQHYVSSIAHPEFSCFENRYGRKTLGDWIENLDVLGLAIWYQDDGTLVDGKRPRFYTLGFSEKEVDILRDVLARKWGLATNRHINSGHRQWFFEVTNASAPRFFNLVAGAVHPVMGYKLPTAYRGKFCEIVQLEEQQPVAALVTKVYRNPSNKRGQLKTSYCIDVANVSNFCTLGELAHNCRDADGTLRLEPELRARVESLGLSDVYRLDISTYLIIERMSYIGLKPDLTHFAQMSTQLASEIETLRARLVEHTGDPEFNANGGDQVSEYLFGTLGLEGVKWLSKSNRYSSDDKILEALEHEYPEYPVIGDIRDYRSTYKLKHTFVDRLPDFVRRWPFDGRIHATFRATRVVTGRLAAADPNLYAQPKDDEDTPPEREFRRGWVADDGHVIISHDLSQIELRIGAHLSGDEYMTKVFRGEIRNKDGSLIDLHAGLGQRIFGLPKKDQTKAQRTAMKAINFGFWMGQTAKGLMVELRRNGVFVTEDDAQRWLDEANALYTGAQPFKDACVVEAERYGYIRCMSGRIRYIGGIRSKDDRIRSEAERFAYSTKIQEGAQYIGKTALAWIWRNVIVPAHRRGEWVEPLLWVHDDFVCEAEERLARSLHVELGHAMTKTFGGLSVPIETSGDYGRTWAASDMRSFQ